MVGAFDNTLKPSTVTSRTARPRSAVPVFEKRNIPATPEKPLASEIASAEKSRCRANAAASATESYTKVAIRGGSR